MQSVTVRSNEFTSSASVAVPTASVASTHTYTSPQYGLRPGLITHQWQLLRYLPVEFGADEDGWYVLTDTVFQVYGDGDTLKAAQRDYISSLIDYYRLVERDALDGDESARREFNRVQEYVRPKM